MNDRHDVGAEARDHRCKRLLVSVPQAGKQLLFVHTGSSMFHIVSRRLYSRRTGQKCNSLPARREADNAAGSCCRSFFCEGFSNLCVGADDSVRPAGCSCSVEIFGEFRCPNVFGRRGRCPHRPGRMYRVLRKSSANSQLPNGPMWASAPTIAWGCAYEFVNIFC